MSSCHCYSQSDTFNLTLLFSPRLHGGLFQLFYGNYDIVSPVSWVNYKRKQAMPLYAISYYFAAKVNSLRNFYITLLSWMFLPWNWEKQAYHHLGNESSNREKSHTSCERMTRNSLGRQNDGWHFDWNRCLLFSRPSGHQEKKIFLLVLQKRLRRCALTWSIWTAFVCHRAIWLIGTSWEYFHHFFLKCKR